LVSLSAITVDESGSTHHITSGLKSVANDIFSPMRSGVDDLINPIGDFFAGAFHYGALQQENQKLQQTIGQLKEQSAEQPDEDAQLRQLLALEHLPFLEDIPTVTARTTEIDTSNFMATITIDQGRNSGVDYGMPVVTAGGLIGQVVQAYATSAVVQLIIDGQSKVGVMLTDQSDATIDGSGPGNPLSVQFVATEARLTKHEILVTSGLQGGQFPPGIPVARLSTFRNTPGASEATVSAQPIADMDALAYVAVVQWGPGS
jgi:rod shape-determining protein MreC